MGWWKIGSGDHMMGDGPADRLLDAFENIEQFLFDSGKPKPRVSAWLHWLLSALRQSDSSLQRLSAHFEDSTQILSKPGDPHLETDAVRELVDALADISLEYQVSQLARRPHLLEILHAFDFVAANRLVKWTSDAPTSQLIELRAITEKPV